MVHRLAFVTLLLAGCATPGGPRPATPREIEAARPSLALLEEGNFVAARREAEHVLAAQPQNSRALVVQAVARYQAAVHQLVSDLVVTVASVERGGFNHKYMRASLEDASRELGAVDAALGRAAADPQIAIELCLACWRVDWNHNGRVDARDERLFEIEEDADGKPIPDGDPRRRPRFRFDVGDLHWARAMVSFQRAAVELVLAYRWEELDKLLHRVVQGGGAIVIHLGDKPRVARARGLILAGLDHADRARTAILAERDDDREWLPNPRQKSHPLPLPVDSTLFATWQGVTEDLRRLVRGDEGLSVREAAQLARLWERPPGGFIDIGRMFADPRDLTFDFATLGLVRAQPEAALASTFGVAYVRSMRSSRLLGRLTRMKGEVDRGAESFGRKLRYLLWLN